MGHIEKAERENGYPKLATLMGHSPEVAIFRRFNTLNARNLLYLQAELVDLETRLEEASRADAESSNLDRRRHDRHWPSLSESVTTPDGNSTQWTLALQIREKLKEYNETLLLQTVMSKQKRPLASDLTFLQEWMQRPSMGYVYLLGRDHDVWDKTTIDELIVLNDPPEHNPIFRSLWCFVGKWWSRLRDRPKKSGGIYNNSIRHSETAIVRTARLLILVLASMLPVVATVVLSLVSRMERRLAIIAIFTAIYSALLGVFGNGGAVEMFSATAAFAAVQVVFVGTTSGSPQGDVATNVTCRCY